MKTVQLKATNKVSMTADGRAFEFWITSEIAADEEVYNWETGTWELKESKTAQRHFVDTLKDAKEGDTVKLYINSYGGSIKEALGIYNTLRRTGAHIMAYIDGFAASAASVIAMAADVVIMPRNTCMMIHNAWWVACGNPAQLRKSADDLDIINSAALQSYITKAGSKLPQEQLKKLLDAETWLSAEQCMAYGLADVYAEQDADMEAAAQQCREAAGGAPHSVAGLPAALAAVLAPQTPPILAAAMTGRLEAGDAHEPEESGQSVPASPAAGSAAPNDGTSPADPGEDPASVPAEHTPADGLRMMLAALIS